MTAIPSSHIQDAQKLDADAVIELFELVPAGGTGTFRFKNDNDVTWRGNTYTGLPVVLSGEEISAENGRGSLKMVVGAPNLDLSLFKPLINDGTIDGGTVTRIRILLADVLANNLVRETTVFEIRQVITYTRTQVTLQLALPSDGIGFVLPFRQYLAPAFPTVLLK